MGIKTWAENVKLLANVVPAAAVFSVFGFGFPA
jgi:hypothetical protein